MGQDCRILEKLLGLYGSHFDIERPFPFEDTVYDAYAYFNMASTKYILVEEAQLWRAYTFEHVFFRETDAFTGEELRECQKRLKERMEPEFVRRGEKYPMPDHMCTYLTNVYICRQAVAEDVARQIRRYRFRLYYRFALRGYCEARLAVLDLEARRIYGNAAARQLVRWYKQVLRQEGIK